jgi:hypothetical protein
MSSMLVTEAVPAKNAGSGCPILYRQDTRSREKEGGSAAPPNRKRLGRPERRMRPHAERRRRPGLRTLLARDDGHRRELALRDSPSKRPAHVAVSPEWRSTGRVAAVKHACGSGRPRGSNRVVSRAALVKLRPSSGSAAAATSRRRWRWRRRWRRRRRRYLFFWADEVANEQADQTACDRAGRSARGHLAVRRLAFLDVVGTDAAADGERNCSR